MELRNQDSAYFLNDTDKKLLIELICSEQSSMIKQDSNCYNSDRYVHLEKLKIQLKG